MFWNRINSIKTFHATNRIMWQSFTCSQSPNWRANSRHLDHVRITTTDEADTVVPYAVDIRILWKGKDGVALTHFAPRTKSSKTTWLSAFPSYQDMYISPPNLVSSTTQVTSYHYRQQLSYHIRDDYHKKQNKISYWYKHIDRDTNGRRYNYKPRLEMTKRGVICQTKLFTSAHLLLTC